jgi:hypothetical protein
MESRSFRTRGYAIRGARRYAAATASAATNTRGLTGTNSPTGAPLRVTVNDRFLVWTSVDAEPRVGARIGLNGSPRLIAF